MHPRRPDYQQFCSSPSPVRPPTSSLHAPELLVLEALRGLDEVIARREAQRSDLSVELQVQLQHSVLPCREMRRREKKDHRQDGEDLRGDLFVHVVFVVARGRGVLRRRCAVYIALLLCSTPTAGVVVVVV